MFRAPAVKRAAALSRRSAQRSFAISAQHVVKTEEVKQAQLDGKGVVALESTIISHGMPYPENVEMALEVEDIIRKQGSVPATVAILDGKILAGLTPAQIGQLGKLGPSVTKCSRRDMAPVTAAQGNGATTVAGTMMVASAADIPVFVTGGLGGVHRGVEETMDISADLMELGRTRCAVVCAGVKSILDIPRTLEVLETQGVTVASLGTEFFPAFFAPSSGIKSPLSLPDVASAARLVHAAEQLAVQSGTVIAVPNPDPGDAALIQDAIQQALREAKERGVTGRDITPFLLGRVNELTSGASLRSNLALVKNNAVVGGQIATQAAALQRGSSTAFARKQSAHPHTTPSRGFCTVAGAESPPSSVASQMQQHMRDSLERLTQSAAPPAVGSLVPFRGKHPVVVGAAVVDMISKPAPGQRLTMQSSTPGTVQQSFGGVGRNVAEAMARLHRQPVMVTHVGDDSLGDALTRSMRETGITPALARELSPDHTPPDSRTGVYNAVLGEEGELVAAVADMAAFDHVGPHTVQACVNYINSAPIVVVDGNVPEETIQMICEASSVAGASWAVADAVADSTSGASAASAGAAPALPAGASHAEDAHGDDADGENTTMGLGDFMEEQRPGVPVWFEPTSVAKAVKGAKPWILSQLAVISPNADECIAMAEELHAHLSATSEEETHAAYAAQAEALQEDLDCDAGLRGVDLGAIDWEDPEVVRRLQEQGVTQGDLEAWLQQHSTVNEDGSVDIDFEGAEGGADAAGGGGQARGGAADSAHKPAQPGAGTPRSVHTTPWSAAPRGKGKGRGKAQPGANDDAFLPSALRGARAREGGEGGASRGAADDKYTAVTFGLDDAGEQARTVHRGTVGDQHYRDVGAQEDAPEGGGVQAGEAAADGDMSVMRLDGQLLTCAQRLLAAMCHPACVEHNAGTVQGMKHVVVTLGKWGVLWLSSPPLGSEEHFLAMCNTPFFQASIETGFDFHLLLPPPADMVNCTGAGDCLVGGAAAALAQGKDMHDAIMYGMGASWLSIQHQDAVPPTLAPSAWEEAYGVVRRWNRIDEDRALDEEEEARGGVGGSSTGGTDSKAAQWSSVRQRVQEAMAAGLVPDEEHDTAREVAELAAMAEDSQKALDAYKAQARQGAHANAEFCGQYEAELAASPLPKLLTADDVQQFALDR